MGLSFKSVGEHYMLVTTLVAAFTAGVNLFIILWMSGPNPFLEMVINFILERFAIEPLTLTALDSGLGLAAIGIITFFGVSLSSSIFEEHRHDHRTEHPNNKIIVGKDVLKGRRDELKEFEAKSFSKTLDDNLKDNAVPKNLSALKDELVKKYIEKKSDFIFVDKDNPKKDLDGHFISNVIVGTGIMRKGLASSLVMTYIVLIGLSFSAGTLDDSFSDGDDANNVNVTSLDNSTVSSNDVNVDIVIKDIVTLGSKVKSIEESVLAIESGSLVQHFTIVISVVIGFYFSANTITAILKARKEDKTS